MQGMKKYRLGDIEEATTEMDLSEIADDVAETDEIMQLVVSGWSVYVNELDLTLREGIVCIWDDTENMFLPDYSVTVIYEGRKPDAEWLYYENDGFTVTVGNWLNGRMPMEQIEQLSCELILPGSKYNNNESEESI